MSAFREEERNSQEDKNSSQEVGIGTLAGIFQGILTSLADLSAATKSQSAAFESLHEDLLLHEDSSDEQKDSDSGKTSTVDPTRVVTALLASSSDGVNSQPTTSQASSDTEQKSDLLDSLTQAFISSVKKSPPIATQIADLIDNILSGKLSADTAKERGEKYFPPENCSRVGTVTVNEEIWDLLSRRAKTVDLAFQRVQDTLTQGLSSLALLADKLAKDAQTNTTICAKDVLQHVMDSLVLISQANWSLNMKRRELIKPDLESPFTKLCKPEIAPTTKLFGDDLSKQLKELTEVSRVGKQLQKKAPEQKRFYQKPYDRPRHTSNRKTIMGKKPFLAYGRATFQSGTSHKKSNQKSH